MLLCADVPSLIHGCNCGAVVSVLSWWGECWLSKPLRDLNGCSSLATAPARMEDQPLVLLFYPPGTQGQTQIHVPAIMIQIGLVLAHIPESTPLLCESLLHRCLITPDSATERITPTQRRRVFFHPGQFGGPETEAPWSTCREIWQTGGETIHVTSTGLSRTKASLIKWLQTNQREKSEEESSQEHFVHWILLVSKKTFFIWTIQNKL